MADDEPWLAAPETQGGQVGWCKGSHDDCEVDDCDDEEGDTGIADQDALHAM